MVAIFRATPWAMIIILEQTSMSICIMDRRFVNIAFYTRVCRVCKGKSLVGCEGMVYAARAGGTLAVFRL